jgi:hypothetical protein
LAQQKCREPGGIAAALQHAGSDPAWRHGFDRRECPLRRENQCLRIEREILKKNFARFLGSTEMKFRLIEDQRGRFRFASCAM